MNKRGMSGVVVAIIMIGIVMVAAVTLWVFVRGILDEEIDKGKSCFELLQGGNKVTLNDDYTCYFYRGDNKIQFSINIGNILVDEVLVAISAGGSSDSITLTNDVQLIDGIEFLNGTTEVSLPGKNSGLTYIKTGVSVPPDSVRIAPIINGKQCEVTDSVVEFFDCELI